MPEGGAEAIASRGEAAEEEEMLDRAAMESGTDQPFFLERDASSPVWSAKPG